MTYEKEKHLLHQLINGDEKAFCQLYATYKNRIIQFVLTFVKSSNLAEDIFQDVFIAVWQNRVMINPDHSFSSYIYTITRNRILNHLRSESYKKEFQEEAKHTLSFQTNNTSESIDENDLKQIIQQGMALLSNRQREIFEMSRDGQLSHKEIAKKLNISTHTVQEHISTSLKTIRGYLQKNAISYTKIIALILGILPL